MRVKDPKYRFQYLHKFQKKEVYQKYSDSILIHCIDFKRVNTGLYSDMHAIIQMVNHTLQYIILCLLYL